MYLCVDKDGSFRVAESSPIRWHHFDKYMKLQNMNMIVLLIMGVKIRKTEIID